MHLNSIVDALIVPTFGFSVFTDTERLSYIQALAKKNGIIILMDSDSAGFKIRSFLHEHITEGRVLDAYIPALPGKEKRKTRASAEGTLGVEGVPCDTLLSLLLAVSTPKEEVTEKITHLHFYEDGLLGTAGSREKRAALAAFLHLPPQLSQKALLAAVNALMTPQEYRAWCDAYR